MSDFLGQFQQLDSERKHTVLNSLPSYLVSARRLRHLDRLMLTFGFIYEKLTLTSPQALINDYDLLPSNDAFQLLKSAVRMAAHVITEDPTQLAAQMKGRLIADRHQNTVIVPFLKQISFFPHLRTLLPLTPSLKLAGAELQRTIQANAPITSAVLSHTQDHLLTILGNGLVSVWNLRTGDLLHTYPSLVWSPLSVRGDYAAFQVQLEEQVQIAIWNWRTNILQRVLPIFDHPGRALVLLNDLLFSGTGGHALTIWNWRNGKLLYTLPHEAEITRLLVEGDYVIAGMANGLIIIWIWSQNKQQFVLSGHMREITSLALANSMLVSGSEDGTIVVWDWQRGDRLHVLNGHTDKITFLLLSLPYLYSASNDGKVCIWDLSTGTHQETLKGHSAWIGQLALVNHFLFTASGDNTVRIWDLHKTSPIKTYKGHTSNVINVSIVDGTAISSSDDGTIQVWDWTDSAQHSATHPTHDAPVMTITVNAQCVLSGSHDTTVRVWDWHTGQVLHTLCNDEDAIRVVKLKNQFAFSGSDDGRINIWKWFPGEHVRTLHGHNDFISSLHLRKNYLLSASGDKTIGVWDWKQGVLINRLSGHEAEIITLFISSQWAFSGGRDNSIRVWNWKETRLLHVLEGHSEWVNDVKVVGKLLFSASDDATVKIWDWQTGQLHKTLHHNRPVQHVIIATNHIYSVAIDTIFVWDRRDLRLLTTLQYHRQNNWIRQIHIHKNWLISASDDYTLRIWDTDTQSLLATFTSDAPLLTCTCSPDASTIIASDALGSVHFLKPVGLTATVY